MSTPPQSIQLTPEQRYNNVRFWHLENLYGVMTANEALALAEKHEQFGGALCRPENVEVCRNSVNRLLEYACLIEAGYPK